MLKVAGYCRVSTAKEDQVNSFASQKRFFREYIDRHPDWQLYEVYADEGITGTSTKKRAQFNRMMCDAYAGKFQLIITKEVSRFSRNILDAISYTRELRALGIGVLFMSDGFSTLDADSELRLSIMGSIAQEESRKTSSRVKWGQTRRMEKGVVFGTSMLGYDVDHGKLWCNPEGAEIVRMIFHKYGMEKKSSCVIARELQAAGYKTYKGNSSWSSSHILKILKNEKYVGDLIQKKTFTPDYLTHTKKYNHGEEDFIILENHHEPIISRELWQLVQQEIKLRNRNNHCAIGHSNRYLFSGKIKCGECGSGFISRMKTRKDGTSYKRWGCSNAAKNGAKKTEISANTAGCDVGKQIRQDLLTEMLIYVIRNLNLDWDWILRNVTALAVNAVKNNDISPEHPDRLKRMMEQIQIKKAKAMDAYLSGNFSKEELHQMKQRYDAEWEALQKKLAAAQSNANTPVDSLQSEILKQLNSIITCQPPSEVFLKALLEYMIIHKNGLVNVKLNQYSAVWNFQLKK